MLTKESDRLVAMSVTIAMRAPVISDEEVAVVNAALVRSLAQVQVKRRRKG